MIYSIFRVFMPVKIKHLIKVVVKIMLVNKILVFSWLESRPVYCASEVLGPVKDPLIYSY